MMKTLKNKSIVLLLSIFIIIQPCFAAENSHITVLSKKFVMIMSGVLLSSLLIYGILKLYKKIFHNINQNSIPTYNENSLETPKDLDSAISNFLNKTDF